MEGGRLRARSMPRTTRHREPLVAERSCVGARRVNQAAGMGARRPGYPRSTFADHTRPRVADQFSSVEREGRRRGAMWFCGHAGEDRERHRFAVPTVRRGAGLHGRGAARAWPPRSASGERGTAYMVSARATARRPPAGLQMSDARSWRARRAPSLGGGRVPCAGPEAAVPGTQA